MNSLRTIRLGARGSLLSRMQSALVGQMLEAACPGVRVELVAVVTTGDRVQDRPLHDMGGKGLFTKEIELALLRKEVDFAVHSFKDVPVTMPLVDTAELVIAAAPAREDARDVLIGLRPGDLVALEQKARVGTGSLRRQAQLLARRPDLRVAPIRGNVDTRLRKLRAGEYDAVILAMAGLKRAGLFDPSSMTAIGMDIMLPAAGQGALALECRRDDGELIEMLARLNDETTMICVCAERAVVLGLNGDCHSPIAAHATIEAGKITLRAAVGGWGGTPPLIRAQACTVAANWKTVADQVVAELKRMGAEKLLAQNH